VLPLMVEPDTIVILDTHWESTFEHIITSAERREGKFTSHELPRGMRQIPYDMPGDRELANTLQELAEVMQSLEPGLTVEYVNNNDARDYRVSFDKIHTRLPGFVTEWTVPRGVAQLMAMLPMAVPGLVLGLAYIFFFNDPRNPLNGLYRTMAILVINTVVHSRQCGPTLTVWRRRQRPFPLS